jgi:uncharacterized protein (TIGR02246 family)
MCGLAKAAVDVFANVSGGSSTYGDVPIQRIQRDVHAVHQHVPMHPDTNTELTAGSCAGRSRTPCTCDVRPVPASVVEEAMTDTIGSTSVTAGDQAVVAHIPNRIIAAWADHDAEAFAAVFAERGSMILPGHFRKGRESIKEFMAAAFQGPYRGTKVTGTPVSIEFLGGSHGVLITEGGVLAPGERELPAERIVRASWVVVKEDGQWLLAAYQNSPRD